ncbi:Mitogen-activated protein kinase kinase kinase 5 [Bulinus truncatus]|nr:Mitogen-activated protein kinase kinase kinase 5 [Bulinus truncatus]
MKFEGRRYYLTRKASLITQAEAQEICKMYGGYRVEIYTNKEFNFLKKFLNEKDKTNWEKKEMIGIGYYGRVYKGVSLENSTVEFAVKEIESPKDEKKAGNLYLNTRKRVEEEIKNLSSSSHERIVQCYGTYFEESKVFIFMEYMSQGNLKDYIENRQSRMTENEVRTFTKQILEGVEYLHSKNTLHRDLKTSSVHQCLGTIRRPKTLAKAECFSALCIMCILYGLHRE